MTTEQKSAMAERIMIALNLTEEDYESLPRGTASEINALLNSFDALKAALRAALSQDPANWREIGHAALALAERGEK